MDASQPSDLPGRTEEEQRAFFEAALARAKAAAAGAGAVERWFELAGSVLKVVFAGTALAECFAPALAHLQIAPAARADAVFHVWDSRSTRLKMVPPIFSHKCFTRRGDIWTMDSRRIKSAYLWGEYALMLFDAETGTGIYWTQSAESLPAWAKAAPMRPLMHWWMEATGCQLLHGAAVASGGQAIVIAGGSGLGKSTTAVAALAGGLDFVGDDFVVLRPDPAPRVYCLYGVAKLAWDQAKRFPTLDGLIANRGESGAEKAVLRLYPGMAGRIRSGLPLAAIGTSRIAGGRESGLEPVSRSTLRHAAAFPTITQLPHAGRRVQAILDRLVDRLPGFRIALGDDLDALADLLRALLASPTRALPPMAPEDDVDEPPGRTLVSVVIPVHNGARFLPEAVASVLGQGLREIEIVVVDDGSTDRLDEAVRALPVAVKFLKQRQSGPSAARNLGIRTASGGLLAFLDVDDLWPADSLRSMARHLADDPDCDVVRGFAQILRLKADSGRYEDAGNPAESFPDFISLGLYRRRAFEAVGLFDESLRFGEDMDWFHRAQERGINVARLQQVTLFVRRHGANMTHGRTTVELNELRVRKRKIERRRQGQSAASGPVDRNKAGEA